MGNFIAHRERRNSGAIHSAVSDMAAHLRFAMSSFDKTLMLRFSAEQFSHAMNATLRLLDASDRPELESRLGMKISEIRSRLGSALAKIDYVDANQITPNKSLTAKEHRVVIGLNSVMTSHAAYGRETLYDDFCYVLTKNGYMNDDEVKQAEHARSLLSLYAVTQMHGSEIDVGEGVICTLEGGYDSEEGISVRTSIPLFNPERFVNVLVFTTGLSPEQYCASSMSSVLYASRWSEPFELNESGKLSLI